MFRTPAVFLGFVALGFVTMGISAQAQSTLTLDDFNLSEEDKPTPSSNEVLPSKPTSALESCLTDSTSCQDSALKSSTKFSIDDVVNLGIIDREEVKPQPVSTNGTQPSSQTLPSIDMEILFDYDSDEIRADQIARLSELSSILKKDKFKDYKFAFLGHSDAKGEADYNRDLSFRRAAAVSQFVSNVAGLGAERVVSKGMGAIRLKTPGDPFGSKNRRVQLILVPVN